MAINRITTDPTTDPTALKDFLDANKTGTFLADAVIEVNSKTLTITKGSAVFTLILRDSAQTSSAVNAATVNTVSSTTYAFKIGGVNSTNVTLQFKGAVLCSNGLLLELSCRVSSTTVDVHILLTADSSGGLVMMYERTDMGSSPNPNTGFRLAGYNSSALVTVSAIPQFGAQKTALSPVGITSNDGSITVSDVYAALQSQLSTRGITSAASGSDVYITDGAWYVKD